MNFTKAIVAAGLLVAGASSASAAVTVLNFTGVATTNNTANVNGFYNGGTSSDGNSGPNFGAAFSSNALAINNYNGSGEPNPGILVFLSGGAVTLDYAAGFTTGFSFVYSSSVATVINVYDAAQGTGNVLASLTLAAQFSDGCGGGYCNWTPIGVTFAGIAKSIDFGGGADATGYDNITFGSAAPGVPEPASWAMLIAGFGLVGAAARRRRSNAVTA